MLLSSRDVFGGIIQVLTQGILIPSDIFLLVSFRIGVSWCLSSFTPKYSMKIGAPLVLGALLDAVTVGAALDENLFPLLYVCGAHFDWA